MFLPLPFISSEWHLNVFGGVRMHVLTSGQGAGIVVLDLCGHLLGCTLFTVSLTCVSPAGVQDPSIHGLRFVPLELSLLMVAPLSGLF